MAKVRMGLSLFRAATAQTALFNPGDELFMYLRASRLKVGMADALDLGHIGVADELPVDVIMSGRERHDFPDKADEVLRLTGKDYLI